MSGGPSISAAALALLQSALSVILTRRIEVARARTLLLHRFASGRGTGLTWNNVFPDDGHLIVAFLSWFIALRHAGRLRRPSQRSFSFTHVLAIVASATVRSAISVTIRRQMRRAV